MISKEIVEFAKKLESKSLKDLKEGEMEALRECRISDDIKIRAVCYYGFLKGLRFGIEKAGEIPKVKLEKENND